MVSDVKWFIKGCSMCLWSKNPTTAPHEWLNPVPIPAAWFDIWSIDFVTNLLVVADCNAVFTCIDKFMKYVHLTPCFIGEGQLSAVQCTRFFFDFVVYMFGVLKAAFHDSDPHFTLNFWLALWDILKTKIFLTSAYHPQLDRQTECTHQMQKQVLRCFLCENPTSNWLELLPMVEFAINSSVQDSMGKTPNELVFKVPLWRVVDYLDGLHLSVRCPRYGQSDF